MKKEDGRLRGMDGLRGVAIIAITLFHMFPSVFRGGYLGVVLFFVLTGFLLVVSAKKKMNQKEFSLRDYYLARIGSLTLAHSRNSQMSFMYGFFFVKFLLYTVVCVVIVI